MKKVSVFFCYGWIVSVFFLLQSINFYDWKFAQFFLVVVNNFFSINISKKCTLCICKCVCVFHLDQVFVRMTESNDEFFLYLYLCIYFRCVCVFTLWTIFFFKWVCSFLYLFNNNNNFVDIFRSVTEIPVIFFMSIVLCFYIYKQRMIMCGFFCCLEYFPANI